MTSAVRDSPLDWAARRVAEVGRAAPGAVPSGSRTVLGTELASGGGLAMSDHIPAPGDADDQHGSEFDISHTAEFAKMRAVMRASERHREGGVDPELEVTDADPSPDT